MSRRVEPAQTEEAPLLPPPSANKSSEDLPGDESHESHDANQPVTKLRACCIIASVGLLIFLQACNFSLLTTTQSAIALDLDAFSEASWFASAYLIAMASLSPLSGRLSQTFSVRNCVFVSTLIFSVGAFVTSRAVDLATFLLGRALTGVGAAGIMPLSIILVIELATKRRRGLFIGLVNSGYTAGVSLGAVIAGALVGPMGWRPIFWMQSPLAITAGVCIFFSLPKTFTARTAGLAEQPLRQKLAQIDYAGAVLLTSSIVILLTTLSSSHISILLILLSLFLLVLFVLNESHLAYAPVIPITTLRSRGVLLTCFAQLLLMIARWTCLFYTPVYAIAVRSWLPAAAGSILIPTNFGFALGGLLAGAFHIRRTGSFYLACIVTFALFPLTVLFIAYLSTPDTPVWLYLLAPFMNGLVTGAALNYTLAHLLHMTAPSTHFISTALMATFRGFAGSFGSSVGGGIFTRSLRANLEQGFLAKGLEGKEELVRQLLGSPALVARLNGPERDIAQGAYVNALRVLFTAAAGLSVVAFAVQAGTGWKKGVEKKEPNVPENEEEHVHGDGRNA